MEKEVIRLEEIKSKKVVELIRNFIKDVMKFQAVLNVRLSKVELKKLYTVIKSQSDICRTQYDIYICIPYIEEFCNINFLSNDLYWPEYAINIKISILELDTGVAKALKAGIYITSDSFREVVYKEEFLPLVSLENIYRSSKLINDEYEKWQEKFKIREIISSFEVPEEKVDAFMSLL